MAPGEGSFPMSLFTDMHCEEASFPNIYCGKIREFPKNSRILYFDRAKWELTNVDRRAAFCIDNIFFKMQRLRVQSILSLNQVRLRKGTRQGAVFKAKELKHRAKRKSLLKCYIGFKDLKTLRGSPYYHEQGKKDLFAMFWQLGTATFFVTNLMADTHWKELLVMLSLLVDKNVIKEDDVDQMDVETRRRLLRSEPVTYARYYRHRMDSLLTVVCSCDDIIGKVDDFFLRDEFQQRGSPHSHWLTFDDKAPVYGKQPNQKICDYVDDFITCARDPEIAEELILLQEHKHSNTCFKREKGCLPSCRFRYPQPPMQRTTILEPLGPEVSKKDAETLRKQWSRIFDRLKAIDKGKELLDQELSDFLPDEGWSEEDYMLALCSSLKRPTLFLARRLSKMRMNSYNKAMLQMTQANMDIQFCLDPYAAATYVASYMMKGQRGMSKAMNAACAEARANNDSIKNIVRHMGNVF
jgi:hypothetical protein